MHLLVISGQHIGLFAGADLHRLVAAGALWLTWPQRLPWLPWACGLAFVGATGYGLLAGFEVPVQRACMMLALVLLWRLRFPTLGCLVAIDGGVGQCQQLSMIGFKNNRLQQVPGEALPPQLRWFDPDRQ